MDYYSLLYVFYVFIASSTSSIRYNFIIGCIFLLTSHCIFLGYFINGTFGKNIEIFKLKPYQMKRDILFIRILMNLLMLVCVSMLFYGLFFEIHQPIINQGDSVIYYFFISIIIVFMNSLIFGLLSYLFSNLFSNRWFGIGISIFTWFSLISKSGRSLPVPINIFLFGTRDQDGNPHPYAKLWIIG